jgi:AraC-like DNA-binding protein
VTDSYVLKQKQYAPTFRHGVHAHEMGSVDFNLAGSGDGTYGGRAVESPAGAVEFFAPGREHSFVSSPGGMRTMHLVFRPDALDEAESRLDDPEGRRIDQAAAVGLGVRLLEELTDPDASSRLVVDSLGHELLAASVRWRDKGDLHARWLDWVRNRLHDERLPTLAELAESAGVHRAHLARSFSAHFGVSVGEYHRRVRLARAAREIAQGRTPIVRIAGSCGFSDQAHLTRWFKRSVLLTPGQFSTVMRRERAALRAWSRAS